MYFIVKLIINDFFIEKSLSNAFYCKIHVQYIFIVKSLYTAFL